MVVPYKEDTSAKKQQVARMFNSISNRYDFLNHSEGMLDVGRKKMREKKVDNIIQMTSGDSENLPFEDNYFDAAIVAFGVRNFENLERGLREMLRVVRPGGRIVILEMSKPSKFPMKQLYNVYFTAILPVIGRWISKDQAAYSYLPESVKAFPDGDQLVKILADTGYKNPQCNPLTFGISTLYWGSK